MNSLEYVLEKYELKDYRGKLPIRLALDRWGDLPQLFKELEYTRGAEIGVAFGYYSKHLFENIPNLHLTCVDAWQHYKEYRDVVSQSNFDKMYQEATEILSSYNCTIIKDFSVSASKTVPNGSLDFVYIDGNHDFLHTTEDIYYWEKKVRSGGIVAGHDFRRSKGTGWQCHVKDVVGAWTYSHYISPWFVLTKEKSASWMWVKT